jgi:hypothetical protein
VLIYNKSGVFLKEYIFPSYIQDPQKMSVSYNRDVIYITHKYGVIKYFRTGIIFGDLIYNLMCSNGEILLGFSDVVQDEYRNVFVTCGDKILKYADRMELVENKSPTNELKWRLSDVLIHEDEYVQSWVYLKSFHRLWDNIELLRSSLFYADTVGNKKYVSPTYAKSDLIIGQNEIVLNSVINRLSQQLWVNLQPLVNFVRPIK